MAILWNVVQAAGDDNREAAEVLGAKVRALRLERGLTLKALGARAGLSHPFLSQLERGLARPSIGSAERIAAALGVPVGMLWTMPRRGRVELVRAGQGDSERHADESAPGGLRRIAACGEPMIVREWTGGSRRWPEEPNVESGEVLFYVTQGGLEVEVDGDVHKLEAGDALIFDGGFPHRVRRTGGASTRALQVASLTA
jgi:transcriptional regulator with XRE-family HTH domain